MKIIYVGAQKESYNPQRWPSFEYNNFYLTLKHMAGIKLIEHPFDLIRTIGKKAFNRRLLELVRSEKPDLVFAGIIFDKI